MHIVTEMLVNVLSLKDDDLSDEGDEKIKPGSGTCVCACDQMHVYLSLAQRDA